MNNTELFDVIPAIEELINFAKFSTDIHVPTNDGEEIIRLSILWEREDYNIMKRSGEVHNPSDLMSRGRFMKMEILVCAIDKIDDREYKNDDDKDKHELLKNNLRTYLGKMNPLLVDYIYWCYEQLNAQAKVYVDSKTEPLKKKFQETLLQLKPL